MLPSCISWRLLCAAVAALTALGAAACVVYVRGSSSPPVVATPVTVANVDMAPAAVDAPGSSVPDVEPCAAPGGEDSWPCYRGAAGNGHAAASGLALTWDEQTNIRWKTAMHGKGLSSPVVAGSQVWLTTAREDGKELFAVCVNRQTGEVVHDVKVFDVAEPLPIDPKNSYASPTPAIDGGHVYVHFGSYGTACLDRTTGKTLWERRDLPCDHMRGPGSSPIVFADLLILIFDGADAQYVVALNKLDGRTVWRKDRSDGYPADLTGDDKKAYATPVVIRAGGKTQLICPSSVRTMSYDPVSGEELWRVQHGGRNVASRPICGCGRLYLTNGGPDAVLLAVKPEGRGDVTASHVAWSCKEGVSKLSSLLLVNDLLFMVNEGGVVSCLNAMTGERLWRHRLGGDFTASPIYADGRLYFVGEQATHVLEAARQPRVLAVNYLDEGCLASPAAVGNSIYLRTATHLYCIEQPVKARVARAP